MAACSDFEAITFTSSMRSRALETAANSHEQTGCEFVAVWCWATGGAIDGKRPFGRNMRTETANSWIRKFSDKSADLTCLPTNAMLDRYRVLREIAYPIWGVSSWRERGFFGTAKVAIATISFPSFCPRDDVLMRTRISAVSIAFCWQLYREDCTSVAK
jgi:hypothetical protein